jgi:thiamine biosynthesis lipoprotein
MAANGAALGGALRGRLNRRRFLTITAAAIASPKALPASTASWRGTALGAPASIILGGTGRAEAADTFEAVAAELDRLENIFSLYRSASALSQLNRSGRLDEPPRELVDLLVLCGALHDATDGAFDPSVQPLWLALARGGKFDLSSVGWAGVAFGPDRIAFARPGMALTLNGVAQGFVTDRIASLLRARGFADVLVETGEIAALGTRFGTPWQTDIATTEGQVVRSLSLADRALAVSATSGTMLGPVSGHILDPRPGGSGPRQRLVAVSADRAVIADGLSTGCCLLSGVEAARAVACFADARIEVFV